MPQKDKITLPKGTKVPDHIAIILDGNGRWARSRGLPVTKGHEYGAKAIKKVIRAARDIGVHTLTIWGFSTENWSRPPKEVVKILSLVKQTIEEELKDAHKEKVRFCHLGRKDRLPKDILRVINKAEEETKNYTKHILNLALDYGGRDEILRTVKKIVADKVPARAIDEDLFSSYLDTSGQPYPYPDLFIRTSGEMRTSGYLPWQMVYTEFYFEPDHLPDMTPEKLITAILDYSRRRRRFGAKDKIKHFKFKPEVIANLEINWWRLQNIPKGTRFRDYAIYHIREQFGVSKSLAKQAAKYLIEGTLEGKAKKWGKSLWAMKNFYKLIRDEIKLAFEPSIAASLQIKLWKEIGGQNDIEATSDAEDTARELYAEVYRISLFQAAKLAHLRVLATVEKNLAEGGFGDYHWDRAEEYLTKFYSALKEQVA
ncbi:di-trans,poly-cis-decaprenylcistransferase [Candidatus Woesebacteria bacterium RBG_16_34_12]|uniref:Isoprenyl transferase n=1 Tax=Candidatus Woesebacteria bacterium RBG_16_34_12 TaxID=1802480 RepID=A0A1F7X9E4_9BACT|nr:MAG: di-trans,poly-cis-decaprenylcistransferase [Candidatus Woesebacteria bacterium RBG_16_34_12]